MLRRTRTTKKLARRIDLQYFARPHTFRRWRFWLSVGVPVVALGWLITQRAQGGQRAYSSGPLSASHAVFSQQCSLCHVSRAGAFFKEVNGQACLSCHDAPVHHENQIFEPECSACHVEHRGSLRLSATSDASCTQCHANLKTRDGQPHYAAAILSFDRSHPDFSTATKHGPDLGNIRLNHYLHLQPNLVGPEGKRVQMACEDCHRARQETDPWPYSSELIRSADLQSASDARLNQSSARMAPIRFATHCAGCHTLQFDSRFGGQQVPHDKPEVIHTFLVKQLSDYIADHPASIYQIDPRGRQLPRQERVPRVARNAAEWVQFRTEEAEWLLWSKTCKQCHIMNPGKDALPEIAPSRIPSRWLEHAEFDHHAHRMMACTACHARIPQSHDTVEISLPNIETCRQCHREKGSSNDAAEAGCFECHQYHDWRKAKHTKGRFSIPELRGTAQLHFPE
jgi:hypothetical protein